MTKPKGPFDYLPCYNCGTCLTQRLFCYYLGVCAGALCVWGHGNASAYEGHFFSWLDRPSGPKPPEPWDFEITIC